MFERQGPQGQWEFPYSAPAYLSAVLRILEDGKEHSVGEIRDRILGAFPLTPEQLSLRRPRFPVTVFVNRVGYAFGRLVFHRAIVRTGLESYRITDYGRDVLAKHPAGARERDL